MNVSGRSRELLRSAAVIGLAAYGIWFGLSRVWPFTVDDSGIVYAYAKHIASGQGPRAVVGGPIVEGYSDFLWVMVLAVATKLGFDTPSIAKVIGAACFVAACVIAGAFVRRLTRPRGRGIDWPEALPAVFMALCPEFVVWAPSGLENALYWMLMMALLWLDVREAERPALAPLSVVAAAAISVTRPEGVLYVAVVLAAKLVDAIRTKESRRQLIVFVAAFAVVLGVYHAIHYAIFRSFVPNTYYAKAPGVDPWKTGKEYVKAAVLELRLWPAAPFALVACTAGLRRTLPALGCVFAAAWFALFSGGDWMPHYRFMGFAIPPLFTLAAVGVARVAGWAARIFLWGSLAPWFVGAASLACSWTTYSSNAPRFGTTRFLRWCHFCSRTEDAQNHIKYRDRLHLRWASMLTHDFGGPSFASSPSFTPLDMLGLCDQPLAYLRFQQKTRNLSRFDFQRAQYFFHEQDSYPTFLYFPENFWLAFPSMPESQLAYIDVNIPERGDGRLIARTRLARAAFVDYFPAVDRFVFRDVDDRFILVGAGVFRSSGGAASVVVALGQRAPSSDAAVLRARADGAPGAAVKLFGEQPELGVRFFSGEPLVLRLPLPPGTHGTPSVDVSVENATKTTVVPLGRVPVDAVGTEPPPLPFPNNLPGTNDAGLLSLGARLRELVGERRERGDHTLSDPALGRKLVDVADRAEKSGAASDAYLALVWAVQADPDLVRLVYRRIAALRPIGRRAPFLEERALLGAFYASKDPLVQLDLTYFYAGVGLWDKARYFADRLPSSRAETPDAEWTRELSHARRLVQGRPSSDTEPSAARAIPIPGVASDFEGEPLGWEREGVAFDAVKSTKIWGVDGEGYFSSDNGGRAATGRAASPPFVVNGRMLSFLVAGDGSAKLNVDLVVDGKAALHATGPRSHYFFFPVLWDLHSVRGKTARLVLSDTDTHGFIAVDHLRIWPELTSAPPEGVVRASGR
ncbi:MAG TPA: hypothetical protein VHC69_01910 [Polyangiaceae bacterium]|nr:hypothetical protein [Polyangiaceae bacterium]